MVAADNDGGFEVAVAHHFVEAQAQSVAFAVVEPTDAGREALEGDFFLGQTYPSVKTFVVGEFFEGGLVGGGDVGGVAGERYPSEGPVSFAKEGSYVGGEKPGIGEGSVVAAEFGFGAQAVAIVEYFGAGVKKTHHGFDVAGHGVTGAASEFVGVGAA